jgi:trehalose/maltose hydrolase-like predicted phosphorylase
MTQQMRVKATPCGGVAAAARQRLARAGDLYIVDRTAAFVAGALRAPSITSPRSSLDNATAIGFGPLLREQRAEWASRWHAADVEIPDDPNLQRLVRFAMFHTIGSTAAEGEAAVGARGLSGPAYSGHVFWDADVFVLPAVAAVSPKRARAILEYRLRRLDAARTAAIGLGRRGARFPWESARVGTDVTPLTAILDGQPTPIFTGDQEEHIVADVAWAAWHYAGWTGDDAFLTGAGYPLLTETARYWASRVRFDVAGRAHIDHVIGPDEYHVDVNDDVFTNLMARWNLRSAAELVDRVGRPADRDEATEWRAVANAIVDGFNPETGLYEQFVGYAALEPLLIGSLAQPPVAADLLLGTERVAASQIIKQADVLMLHHLLPDEAAPGSLAANLAFYAPRTAHGSSLSPAIHAALCARVGHSDEALHWLRLAARLDLDDVTSMTAGGLHLATMGGIWQAVAFGFVGMRWDGTALRVDPRLPAEWSSLTLRCLLRSARVVVRVWRSHCTISCDRPLPIADGDGVVRTVTSATFPIG